MCYLFCTLLVTDAEPDVQISTEWFQKTLQRHSKFWKTYCWSVFSSQHCLQCNMCCSQHHLCVTHNVPCSLFVTARLVNRLLSGQVYVIVICELYMLITRIIILCMFCSSILKMAKTCRGNASWIVSDHNVTKAVSNVAFWVYIILFFVDLCLRCFDAVGWVAGRASVL